MNIAIKSDQLAATKALAGRVSVVTGSTSGIGLGIVRALAAAGSAVVINGFGKPEAVAEAQAQIRSDFDVKVSYSSADMSQSASIQEMIDQTVATFGRLDILVNNAGIQYVAPLQDFPPEKWDAILAINLSSAFHTSRLALPSMLASKWGRIINVASAHGLVGSPFKAAYVAAKHGIVGLTKVIALETAEHGITCNAICPGYVYTPLSKRRSMIKRKRTASHANRSFAKSFWLSSRTSASQPSKSWALWRCSSLATPQPQLLALRCR